MRKGLSLLLMLCLVLTFAQFPVMADSDATLQSLQAQYPHGTYWNGGNPNSYTSNPCTHHGSGICDYSGSCGCNSFMGLGIQCLGFAYQLATIVFGGNQYIERTPLYDVSALDSLKAGDIVRYKNGTHSIFITGVDGDWVTYADCNSDRHCIILWGQQVSKATLAASFTYLDPAPYEWIPGAECDCTVAYAGDYTCITSAGYTLNIRSGHGTSFSVLGSIPSGATVSVLKANGTWAHIIYNGISGYASMEYLECQHIHFYDTACDAECNECGGTRETKHSYDNDCDVNCNECGEIREIEHVFDDDSDIDCNVCGEERELGEDPEEPVDPEEPLDPEEPVDPEEPDAEFLYGDANGDNTVDGRDVILLCQYLANYDYDADTSTVEIAEGANANGDDMVDGRDVILLCQYLANYDYDSDSSTIVLGPQE